MKKIKFKPTKYKTRRDRLDVLIEIGSAQQGNRWAAHDILRDALHEDEGSLEREKKLRVFFEEFIPQGWLVVDGAIPEDQHFLLYAPKQETSFWFDW